MSQARSSRQRYRTFRQSYRERKLDDASDLGGDPAAVDASRLRRGKRREYLREYLRWLWPHRYAVGAVFLFALLTAGLQMIEPLFMRFIIDRVLLNTALDTASRLVRLNAAGGLYLGVIFCSRTTGSVCSTSASCCRCANRSSIGCCTCRCPGSGT
jgi:ATP-binding cassette subfamily B protein